MLAALCDKQVKTYFEKLYWPKNRHEQFGIKFAFKLVDVFINSLRLV